MIMPPDASLPPAAGVKREWTATGSRQDLHPPLPPHSLIAWLAPSRQSNLEIRPED